MRHDRIFVTICLGALLFISGCASTEEARFYALTPLNPADASRHQAAHGKELSVGIGPIKLPDYLDRPQIVTRASANKLELAEFDRWAGSLEEAFSRTLTDNLSVLLQTNRVFIFPWRKSIPIDYQVLLDVSRFDGALSGEVSLNARWTIYKGKKKAIGAMNKSNIRKSAPGDYAGLVAAQSQALADLSEEIAGAITALSKR